MPIIFFITASFLAGIVSASLLTLSEIVWVSPFISLVLSIIALRKRSFKIFLVLLAFLTGLIPMYICESSNTSFKEHIPDRCIMYGRITDITETDAETSRLTLSLRKVSNSQNYVFKTRKKVYVYCNKSLIEDAVPGYEAVVNGELTYPVPSMNFGGFNLQRYYSSVGVVATCNDPVSIKAFPSISPISAFYKIRNFSKTAIHRHINGESADFVTAVLLGDRSGFSEKLSENSRKAGISHVTAVSGMHVSILMSIVLLLAKPFSKRRKTKAKIVMWVLIFYMILSGLSPSVIRASVMGCCCMWGVLTGKRSNSLLLLSLCAAVMLALNPYLLYNPSFMLSFISTAGLVLLLPVFQQKVHGTLQSIFLMTVVANIVTLPYVMWNFDFYSWIGLFSNLLIVPLISSVFMGGFLSVACSPIPFLASAAGTLTNGICSIILTTTDTIATLPFGQLYINTTNIFLPIAWYSAVLMLYFMAKRKSRQTFLCFSLVICTMCWYATLSITEKHEFSVTQLYAGQGDSAVIRIPGGNVFLIDTGDATSSGRSDCLDYLIRNDIRKIDGIILSHEDSDHAGALDLIAETIKVKNIYISENSLLFRDLSSIKSTAEKHGCRLTTVRHGDTASFGNVSFSFYSPGNPENSNSGSLVTLLSYRQRDFLFTGDIDSDTEDLLIPYMKKCHVLKVAHHGSENSTSEAFLKTVSPDYAVISAGVSNSHFHPHSSVTNRLRNFKTKTYVTANNGGIRFRVVPSGKIIVNKGIKHF